LRSLVFLVTGLFTVACGAAGVALPTIRPGATPTAASIATPRPSTPAQIDVCALMPLGEVQADSPFSTPLATAVQGGASTICEYRSDAQAAEPVGVIITVTDFGTAENALVHQANYRQQAMDDGFPMQEISGLGDDAFAFGSDEVGVHAARGALVVDVNLGGDYPATTDPSKVAAGKSLVGKVFARLP
jgi:hypothetical protein